MERQKNIHPHHAIKWQAKRTNIHSECKLIYLHGKAKLL